MKKQALVSIHRKYILLIALINFVFAFFMPDSGNMWSGLVDIWRSPSYIFHDYIAVGGLAATYLNITTISLLGYAIFVYAGQKRLHAMQIAAFGIYMGHSFFGGHIFNMLPLMIGVILSARWSGKSVDSVIPMIFFTIAMAPIVSVIAVYNGITASSLIIACLTGLILGFFSIPVAQATAGFHLGFTLFNYGLAAGLLGAFSYVLMKYFGILLEPASVLAPQASPYIIAYLLTWVGVLLFASFRINPSAWRDYFKILKDKGQAGIDFIATYGLAITLMNMAVMGLMLLTIMTLCRIPLTGALLGAIFTVVGFASIGFHPLNTLPIIVGVGLASLLSTGTLSTHAFALTMTFSCGLAPLSGHYGWYIGILAGFLHWGGATMTGAMHGSMVLFNNGFSTGVIAMFLVPILNYIIKYYPNHFAKIK